MLSRRFIDQCTDERLELTDQQIEEVHRRASRDWVSDRQMMAALIATVPIVVLIALGVMLLLQFGLTWFGVPSRWAMMIAGGSMAMVIPSSCALLFPAIQKRHIRRMLVASGHPICIGCGYLLEGVSGTTCPECGRTRDLREQARGS